MSYLDLFQRYGNPSREAEIRLTAYLLRPDVLTAGHIKAHDDSAARMIARCNELKHQRPGIETMQDTDKRSWER